MAKQLARALEPLRPLFIEGTPSFRVAQPLLSTQPEEIADLAKMVSTPIALGKRLFSRHEFRPYLERRAIDIAQPDVAHCGGISELHRLASYTVETYDVALAPHCPLGSIALAACMQVDVAAPSFMIQETSLQMHYNEGADLLTYLVDPSDLGVCHQGRLRGGSHRYGPGLGIEVNEGLVRDMAAKHASEKAWRNAVWTGPDGSLREW
ncbi:enolase C-terminal domain-like protein [Earliella scabrosa]|nr:enolase C-terminal domain-like protein [Earliella scabrosa]